MRPLMKLLTREEEMIRIGFVYGDGCLDSKVGNLKKSIGNK